MARRQLSKSICANPETNSPPSLTKGFLQCAPTHLPLSHPFCYCRTYSKKSFTKWHHRLKLYDAYMHQSRAIGYCLDLLHNENTYFTFVLYGWLIISHWALQLLTSSVWRQSVSACDRESKAAWKLHTFITLQDGGDIRVKSTEKVGVVCCSHSHK